MARKVVPDFVAFMVDLASFQTSNDYLLLRSIL